MLRKLRGNANGFCPGISEPPEVARHWLPSGDEKAIRVLVTDAQSSEKYLRGIASLARRARFLAQKQGRLQPTFQDLATAL